MKRWSYTGRCSPRICFVGIERLQTQKTYSRKCGIWASWGQGKQHVQFVNITIAIGPFSNQFIL